MKILFLTSGARVPSSRFRVLQFLPHLERLGHECVVAASRPEKYQSYRWAGSSLSRRIRRRNRIRDLQLVGQGRFDLVFLERELFSDDTYDVEQRFREAAETMVLDVDDALFLLHPQKFEVLASMCDAVLVGNELLQHKTQPLNDRVTLIPTCVDLDRYTIKKLRPQQDAAPMVLGWTGTSANLQYLSLIQEPLQQLSMRFSIELRVIAENRRPLRRLDLDGIDVHFVRWNEQTEIDDLCRFDIGLMPMPDEPWTQYKCGLKVLQYMALGIPSVASPVGVNTSIVQHGQNGYLAQSPDDWNRVLSSLIEHRAQHESIIAAGRQTVEQGYSVQKQAPRMAATLESVVAERQ